MESPEGLMGNGLLGDVECFSERLNFTRGTPVAYPWFGGLRGYINAPIETQPDNIGGRLGTAR